MTQLTSRSLWQRQRFLLLRRSCQLTILGLFLLGPWAGIWWLKGNLSSSVLLDTVPFSDPFILLQSMLAGHWPEFTALLGGLILLIGYGLIGGRAFCSWVCPVNLISDGAFWLRQRLQLPRTTRLRRHTRYYLLVMISAIAAIQGALLWELFNPVNQIQRGLIYGMGASWLIIVALFVFDSFVVARGWCGHLCPMGAFYSLLNRATPLKVVATHRDACNDCGDCYRVCPESFIIKPALKGDSAVISGSECTSCGRCIDVCEPEVFRFANRFNSNYHALLEKESVRRKPL